jgi:hypothetical protein
MDPIGGISHSVDPNVKNNQAPELVKIKYSELEKEMHMHHYKLDKLELVEKKSEKHVFPISCLGPPYLHIQATPLRACLAGLQLLQKRLRLWLLWWSGFSGGVESF